MFLEASKRTIVTCNNEEGKLNVKPKVQFPLQNISINSQQSKYKEKTYQCIFVCSTYTSAHAYKCIYVVKKVVNAKRDLLVVYIDR